MQAAGDMTAQEVLDILAEECLEVAHIVSKIRRFGMDSVHPVSLIPNKVTLRYEIADVMSMIEWAIDSDIVDFEEYDLLTHMEKKHARVLKFRTLSLDTEAEA